MQTELKQAMEWLAEKPNTLFIGQSVGMPGTRMYSSFKDIPQEKLVEFPVAEELQLGVCIGLSLQGFTPISIFPRFNFLILAMNQLVNHLDRIPLYSLYKPKVIIRTVVGHSRPLDPGPQHQDDFTKPMKLMLKTVEVVRIKKAEDALISYQEAYVREGSTILVE